MSESEFRAEQKKEELSKKLDANKEKASILTDFQKHVLFSVNLTRKDNQMKWQNTFVALALASSMFCLSPRYFCIGCAYLISFV